MRRANALVLSALLSYAIFAWARLAGAQGKMSPAVYVLTIETEDADDQADGLTQAIRSRVRETPEWSLAESAQSFETLAIALRCPETPDARCLERIGDQLRASTYVWGTLALTRANEVTAEVHLWTRGAAQKTATATYSSALKDSRDPGLRAVAANLFRKLTGTPTGPAPASETHAVDAPSASETSETSRAPAVEDRKNTDAVLSTPPADVEPHEGIRKSAAKTAVGWTSLVAGAGLIVAATVEGLDWQSDKNVSAQDRARVPNTVRDVCASPVNAAARDACTQSRDAKTASVLGWVFGGAGAALVGAGVFLLVSEGPGAVAHKDADRAAPLETTKIDVIPEIGARHASLGFRIGF